MKHFTRLIVVLLVLVAFTNIASAARPQPEPFTTTGYTTNIILIPTPPYLVPLEFRLLPDDYAQFHFVNQGGPTVDNDAVCASVYGEQYGISTCQELCVMLGQACGVSGYFTGSFSYDEWGVADQATQSGANHGKMTITTPSGNADLRFSGSFSATGVNGGFEFLGGTDAYEGIRGGGTKTGAAGPVFSVTYTPCGRQGQPACPTDRCAVFGSDLKLARNAAQWKIANRGEQVLAINRIMVVWSGANPEAIPDLDKVKLDDKTIAGNPTSTSWTDPMTGWRGKWSNIDEGEQLGQIGAGQAKDLVLYFKRGSDISANPWDFTILVEFEGGCAVPFVAFPPAQ